MYNKSTFNILVKKVSLITIILILVLFIAACNDNSGPVPAAIKEDSTLNIKSVPVDSNQVTTISTDSLDSNSRAFIVKAATANFMEISKATVALKKAGNTPLKDFSKTIVDEHTQLNNKLKNIVHSKKIDFPADVNESQQNEIDAITKQQGRNFDVNYTSNMIGNIQADLEYYTQASKSLGDPDLRRYAADALPILLKDLDALKAIKKGL